MSAIYSIEINNADGSSLDWEKFRGKKILIVNVASECGYTPQYEGLQALQEKYADQLVVIGVPCNDFGGQEPGTEAEIVSFCKVNYGANFPLTQKVSIKGEAHPLYDWLTSKDKNEVSDNEVKWNFHKFLINSDGTLHASHPSDVKPLGKEITSWVES